MNVCVRTIGGREFLDCGGILIPIDQIKQIQTEGVANGGCSNSVLIEVEGYDPREFIWAYENADAIREFIQQESRTTWRL